MRFTMRCPVHLFKLQRTRAYCWPATLPLSQVPRPAHYCVRLYFAELTGRAASLRQFSVIVEDVIVLANYTIGNGTVSSVNLTAWIEGQREANASSGGSRGGGNSHAAGETRTSDATIPGDGAVTYSTLEGNSTSGNGLGSAENAATVYPADVEEVYVPVTDGAVDIFLEAGILGDPIISAISVSIFTATYVSYVVT